MANLSGGLTGAANGAAAGSSFGPWGALIGGGIGGIAGLLQDDGTGKAIGDYQTKMAQAANQYQSSQRGVLDPYADLYTPQGVKSSLDTYTSALSGTNPTQYAVEQSMGKQSAVDPLANWQDYLDPSLEYQQESARKNVEESAAGQGGLYSGAAAREIASDVADIASTGYNTAMANARQNAIDQNAVDTQNLQNAMSAGNYNVGLGQTRLGNLGAAYNTQQGLMDTYSSGISDLNKTALGTSQSAANVALQAKLGTQGGNDVWGDLLNATKVGTNLKGLFSPSASTTAKGAKV